MRAASWDLDGERTTEDWLLATHTGLWSSVVLIIYHAAAWFVWYRLKGEARLTVICNCYLEISQASSFNLISSSYLTPDFIWILSAPKESLEKIQMKSGVRYELDMRLKELA